MIFKRLFNWIKFKTLPPSVLFRNRLFIERDSKSRRVTSNLGLTFRNSKWVNYARTDVTLNSKQSYKNFVKYFIINVIALALLISFSKFYNPTLSFNEFTYLIWWFKDTTSYYLFTLFSFFTIFITLLVEKIYTYFSGWMFLNSNSVKKTSYDTKPLMVQSGDYKYLYYSWLTESKKQVNQEVLENLFETPNVNTSLLNNSNLLNKVFTSSYMLNRLAFQAKNFSLDTPSNILNSPTNTTFQALELNYNQNSHNQTSFNFNTSLTFLNNNLKWCLSNTTYLNENSNNLVKGSSGSFLLNNWNFAKYNHIWVNKPNAYLIYEAIENQLNSLKVSKFLYHYSYLHRNILKNSHKLTTVKKLISSGFYDTRLITHNMWSSDLFNTLENPQNVLNSELNVTYGNFFKEKFFNQKLLNNYSINNSQNSSNFLSFYEQSYFWTLKRLFNFNSLEMGNIHFTFKPSVSSKVTQQNSNFNTHLLKISSLYKSDLVTNFNFLNYVTSQNSLTPNSTNLLESQLRDILTLNRENDLISVDDESILLELTNSPSSKTPRFAFYNTLTNKPSNFLEDTNLLDLTVNSKTPSSFYYLKDLQFFYVNDLIFLLKHF